MRFLLRLYPAAWRARYGEEFAALLEDQPLTPRIALDTLLGALDAHVVTLGSQGRIGMVNRLRSSQIAVFCAYIAFVVAGIGFQKMTEYDDFMAARSHTLVGVPFDIVVAGAAISLLAVLAGGVPLALSALRFAWERKRWDIALLLATPAFALALLLGYGAFLLHIANNGSAQFSRSAQTGVSLRDKVFFALLVIGFAVAAVASTWAVCVAIRRAEISAPLFRFARIPALVTAVVMLAVAVATLVWGLGLRGAEPGLLSGNDGVMATNTTLSWLAIVVVMALASLVALVASLRGLRVADDDSGAGIAHPALA